MRLVKVEDRWFNPELVCAVGPVGVGSEADKAGYRTWVQYGAADDDGLNLLKSAPEEVVALLTSESARLPDELLAPGLPDELRGFAVLYAPAEGKVFTALQRLATWLEVLGAERAGQTAFDI